MDYVLDRSISLLLSDKDLQKVWKLHCSVESSRLHLLVGLFSSWLLFKLEVNSTEVLISHLPSAGTQYMLKKIMLEIVIPQSQSLNGSGPSYSKSCACFRRNKLQSLI